MQKRICFRYASKAYSQMRRSLIFSEYLIEKIKNSLKNKWKIATGIVS